MRELTVGACHIAVKKAPRRISMKEQNRITITLIDVVAARQTSSAVGGCADGPWSSLALDGGAFSLLSGVAGVAPACALAGAFAKASAQASSGPVKRRIAVFALFSTQHPTKRAERGTGAGFFAACA
jgi:hypothetical protein